MGQQSGVQQGRPYPSYISYLAGLCAVGFFARFSYSLARTPVLPLFALYLGAGPEAIGGIVGISTVTGIFFKLPSGALSDIIGRTKTMLIGLVVFAVMPFAYLWVNDYHSLFVIRFLHGFATAIYGPVAMAVVAESAGGRRGEMISWFSSITIIGNLLGAPVGGLILHNPALGADPVLADFRLAYLLSGLAGAMSLVLGLVLLRGGAKGPLSITSEGEAAPISGLQKFIAGIKETVSDKRVLLTSNVEGVQNMAMGALEAFLPIYAVTVAGLSELQAGLLWGAQVVVTIVSKPVMGRLSDTRGRKPVIMAGMALCAVSFGLIPFLSGFYPILVAALFFGLGEAFVTSSSAALIADVCNEKRFGAAMGAFGTIFDIGHAAGPILAGFLIAGLGYQSAFLIIAGLLLAFSPVFYMYVEEPRRG